MKKTIALVTASLALVALAGCDGVAEPHEHTFKQEWETNETHHWHNASCEHTDLVKDLNTHDFGEDNICNDCGYTKPAPVVEHEHTFATSWAYDETNHWHAATCEHTTLTSGLVAHNYGGDNVCDECGYEKPAPVVPHEHTFATSWTHDETNHWHTATCEHTELTSGLAVHSYGDDNICDDCGYEKPAPVVVHEHTYSNVWSKDETNHWHASTCEHTDLTKDFGAHVFGDDNICDVCGCEYVDKYYSVIWKNYDGQILEIDYGVKEGTIPTCETTPVKEDGAHVFNFVSWSPEVTPITKNMVFTANFEQDTSKRLVIFKDDEGNELNRQFVTLGEEPDMTKFIYKGIIVGNQAKVFTHWDKPFGKIYDDTTFVGVYETYDKVIGKDTVKDKLSIATLGENMSFNIYTVINDLLDNLEEVSFANNKTKSVKSFTENSETPETIVEMYQEEGYRYIHHINNHGENATISKIEQTPLIEKELTYYMGDYTTADDYTFDVNSGLFVGDDGYYIISLKLEDGKITWMSRDWKKGIDNPSANSSHYELEFINVGEVEPFNIPDYNYTGLNRFLITFKDNNGSVISEQFLYDGMMPDVSKLSPATEITDDNVIVCKWDKEFVPASEDATYTCNFYEYKKTYTTTEISDMLRVSSLGNNLSFDYTHKSNDNVVFVKHYYLANGIYKAITIYDPTTNDVNEVYIDSDYRYDYDFFDNQVDTCNKRDKTRSAEEELEYVFNEFRAGDFTYDETIGMYYAENSMSKYWLNFKDGKIDYLKRELIANPGKCFIINFTSYGGVEPFSVPVRDWIDLT